METKTCSMCKQILSLDKFYARKDGLYGKHKTCKDCYKNYQRKKVRLMCELCGKSFNRVNGYSLCPDCRSLRYDATDVVVTHCGRCVFERECKNNINFKDWQPYCHTTAKYHEFYVREYGHRSAAAGVAG